MFERHKAKKAAKQKMKQLIALQNGGAVRDVKSQSPQDEKEETERLARAANYEALRRTMSFRNDIRENILWIILGAVVLFVEYLLVGIYYTLPTFVVMALIVKMYTSRFYRVPMQYVLLMKVPENSQVFIGFFGFPLKIFNNINVVGLENMIRTPNYGPVYLVSDIEFDGNVPVSMTFSYVHFPEFDFLTKRQTYPIMVEYLNRLIVVDTKLRELMDMNVSAMSAEMTAQRLKRISQGKTEDVFALNREREKLIESIKRLMEDNNIAEQLVRNNASAEGLADEYGEGMEDEQAAEQ
ncbi:MAG: hypothetical protein M1138_04260 [Candidatus Thermoplasmatota archaeon]|nr:hypothetical protein [Candidatus Thermoplasmatota archaeon]